MATATANNGAPDDVDINANGQLLPNQASTPGLTLNSSNVVTNEGTIQFNNINNSTSVLILGGNTGSFTNSGTINNIEDFDPPDNNQDGVVESPLAVGTGRYGLRVTGTAPFVGDITNTGSIFTEGNDSSGVSIEAPITGSFINGGTIGVTGDRSFGLKTTAPISGAVNIIGPISTSGQAATAVSIGGDVGGALTVYSAISSNGFSTSSRSITDTFLKQIQGTPSEVEQSGPAMVVGASVAGGVLFGAPPVTTAAGSTADLDGDGVPDGSEATASLTSFGSAPALVIGGANRNITLGAFGSGDNAYGLIVRGTISSTGLYDNIPATGIQIGGTGGVATVTGGLRLVGTVDASAYEAPATALHIEAGGVVPEFRNENGISATILHSSLSPATTGSATAVLVDAGGTLSTLTNLGTISASVTSAVASAAAVVDKSGTLSTINNQGIISATLTPATVGGSTSGTTTALDLSANTTGVTLIQTANTNPVTLTVTTDANGNVLPLTTSPTAPEIIGDVFLGNGNNTVKLLSGIEDGALSLGNGVTSLTIDGSALYRGALTYTGSNLTVSIPNGALTNTSPIAMNATSLSIGAAGTLSVAVDPANNRAGGFIVSGPATIADGAQIGINLVSNLTGPESFVLISSHQLSVGSSVTNLLGPVPYVTIASLSLDSAVGTLSVNLRQRTAAEAGFNQAETAAMQAIYAALPADKAVQDAVFTPTDRATFIGVYDQLLPDYSGGVFRLASAAARAVSRASADADGPWLQEITVGARLPSGHNAAPFNAWGLGVAGGMERNSTIGIVGVTGSLFTGDVRNPASPGDNRASESQLEAGLTWRNDFGALRLEGRAAGGYLSYNYRRELDVIDPNSGVTTLDREANGKSSGFSVTGHFGASYRLQAGRWYLQPQSSLDYFRLSEGGYTESGGGDAFDLSVAKRLSSETSASVSVRAGGSFGRDFTWRPELEFGYHETFTGGPGVTTANFVNGQSFTLDPANIQKGGAFGRFGFAAGNDLYDVSIAAGAEMRGAYTEGDLHFRLRLLF